MLPLLQAYVAGYDVCLVVAGESGTAKLTALLGDPSDDSRPGLVKLAVDQLLGGSDSSYGTHGKLMVGEADYAASFWEINNEVRSRWKCVFRSAGFEFWGGCPLQKVFWGRPGKWGGGLMAGTLMLAHCGW